jgi:hypothetical protein
MTAMINQGLLKGTVSRVKKIEGTEHEITFTVRHKDKTKEIKTETAYQLAFVAIKAPIKINSINLHKL